MGRTAGIERLDQRLLNGNCPIISAPIAPRFQVMGFGNLPLAEGAGLIGMGAKMDTKASLGQRRRKVEINWGGIDRVAAQDEERCHLARRHCRHQFTQGLALIRRVRDNRRRVDHRLAAIA